MSRFRIVFILDTNYTKKLLTIKNYIVNTIAVLYILFTGVILISSIFKNNTIPNFFAYF